MLSFHHINTDKFSLLGEIENISYKLYGWPQNIFVCLFCVCFIKRGFSVASEFVLVHSVIQADPSAFASWELEIKVCATIAYHAPVYFLNILYFLLNKNVFCRFLRNNVNGNILSISWEDSTLISKVVPKH